MIDPITRCPDTIACVAGRFLRLRQEDWVIMQRASKSSRVSKVRRLLGRKVFRPLALGCVTAIAVLMPDQNSVVAQSKTTKKLSFFKGRVVVSVPKTAKTPQKLFTNLFRVEPTDATKKCVLYISRDSLGSDEIKLKNKALGASIKLRLQGDGYTVSSFKTQGQSHTAYLTGFTEAPWQKVGSAAVYGVGKFTRTADKQLIGSVLLCDPTTWEDTANKGYKTAVLKTAVTQR
jgi:hypothetical protein